MVGCATLLLVSIDLASVQLCGSAYTQCQVSCSCLCNRVLPVSLCFITLVSPRSPGTCTVGALVVASVCVVGGVVCSGFLCLPFAVILVMAGRDQPCLQCNSVNSRKKSHSLRSM